VSRLLALLVIPLTAGALLGACEDREITPPVPGAREIEVTASACRFEPDQIRVDASEDIAIVLTSTDVSHDFTVDDLDVYVEVTGSARHDYPRRRREPRSLAPAPSPTRRGAGTPPPNPPSPRGQAAWQPSAAKFGETFLFAGFPLTLTVAGDGVGAIRHPGLRAQPDRATRHTAGLTSTTQRA